MSPPHRRAALRVAATPLFLTLALLTGCEDLRQFSGPWSGPISRDPAFQLGFTRDDRLSVEVGSVSRLNIDLTVTLPRATGSLRFEPIRRAGQDALADLALPGAPLRTYLGFLRPPGEEPYLTVVSLYAEDRIELRLIRGPDTTYAIFPLDRTHDAN